VSSPLIEIAHRLGSQAAVLAPPYRAWSALPSRDALPPASVVVGKGDTTIAVLAELTTAVCRWPSVIPCLVMPIRHEHLEPLLMRYGTSDRLAVAAASRRSF
jgi:hypothetical protein